MKEKQTMPVNVVKVIDGDSMRVKRSGLMSMFSREFEVRMYGIDAPEYRQPMGPESREALIRHMKGGQMMAEITDTDHYGRRVALLYHKNRGRKDSVNLAMVQSGHAHWYSRYGGKELGLDKAQNHAKTNSLGLWKLPDAQKPWDYRKQKRGTNSNAGIIKWLVILALLATAAMLAAKATGII